MSKNRTITEIERSGVTSRSDQRGASASSQQIAVLQHVGPLPHPSILGDYDKVLPGAPDRIMAMAEEEGRHRREMEKRHLEASMELHMLIAGQDARDIRRGQLFAFILGLSPYAQPLIAQSMGRKLREVF